MKSLIRGMLNFVFLTCILSSCDQGEREFQMMKSLDLDDDQPTTSTLDDEKKLSDLYTNRILKDYIFNEAEYRDLYEYLGSIKEQLFSGSEINLGLTNAIDLDFKISIFKGKADQDATDVISVVAFNGLNFSLAELKKLKSEEELRFLMTTKVATLNERFLHRIYDGDLGFQGIDQDVLDKLDKLKSALDKNDVVLTEIEEHVKYLIQFRKEKIDDFKSMILETSKEQKDKPEPTNTHNQEEGTSVDVGNTPFDKFKVKLMNIEEIDLKTSLFTNLIEAIKKPCVEPSSQKENEKHDPSGSSKSEAPPEEFNFLHDLSTAPDKVKESPVYFGALEAPSCFLGERCEPPNSSLEPKVKPKPKRISLWGALAVVAIGVVVERITET